MKITDKICFSHLLWAMNQPKFTQSISKVTFTKPDITNEGMAGYIETNVEIEVSNIVNFAEIWNKWYITSDHNRMHYRRLALDGAFTSVEAF